MMKESFVIFIALLAPLNAINAPIKHDGKAHFHPRPRQEPNTPVQGLGELEPPTAASTSLSTSSLPNTVSSYLFPTTVIQEPVATVCPGTPASSAMFSILPISSLASLSIPNSTHSRHWKATDYIPIHVNATAMLPNGSSTVFLSASTTSVVRTTSDAGPTAKTARIILGSNGCQTVYSAVTTAWCSTTIQPAGMLPVRITDCDQQVTFSSQSLDGCSVSPSATGLSRNGPVAYFVAHWYDLVRGSIPNVVQVQDCLPASSSGLSCSTSSESWSVVTSTITSTGTSVASFSGLAVVTSGTYTLTTSLSFESTVTTTAEITSLAVVRHRLEGGAASTLPVNTVTVVVTMPTTKTLSLDAITRVTTITLRQTSTVQVQVTETRTRTIDGA